MSRYRVVLLRFLFGLFACWVLNCALGVAAERHASRLAARESIRAEQLLGHVEYLADDQREGRQPGCRGWREAGDYLAQRFAEAGMPGGGIDGGYFQPFDSKDGLKNSADSPSVSPKYRNVIARLEGSDPELKREFIIVGAHYDHVGFGSRKSSRDAPGRVHNGADDNASGTAALLELAEAFPLLPEAPRRSILLIAFDAEEIGLLGSKHWNESPTVPLPKVRYMFNLDMIGRLRDEQLTLIGWRSGAGMRRLLSEQNAVTDLTLAFPWALKGNADHFAFFSHKIPVLFFHTGLHDDYHTWRDDADRINAEGMSRVVRLLFETVCETANRDEIPRFRQHAEGETDQGRDRLLARRPRLVDRLGATWSTTVARQGGVWIQRVNADSPAQEADLRGGDRVVEIAGRRITSSHAMEGALATAPETTSMVVYRRGTAEPITLGVSLNGAPVRLGISWRTDAAEPAAVVLTHVIPETPAAWAGLQAGDRIYRLDGEDFAGEQQFAERVGTASWPLRLTVERDGKVHTVEVREQPATHSQAA